MESDNIESIWFEICHKNSKSFLICFVYRPPHSSIEWISPFNVQVQKVDELCKEYHIIGDLNYKYYSDKNSFECKEWSNFALKYGLSQLVNKPTRMSKKSSTIIDHIYTNRNDRVTEIFVSPLSLSDHFPVCMTRKIKKKKKTDHLEAVAIRL